MKVSQMFPSKYLTGADLAGRNCTVTIITVNVEKCWDQKAKQKVDKYVLYFAESHSGKGMILGKTVAEQIAVALGSDDTDDWIKKQIVIYPITLNVAGKEYVAIRAKAMNGSKVTT